MYHYVHVRSLILALLQYIGRDGIVQSIRYCGDVVVRYPNTKLLQVNGQCLTQVKLNNYTYVHVYMYVGKRCWK